MICDWQIFWHEHRKRPRLITGIKLDGGYTEYLADDGTIQRKQYGSITAMMAKAFEDVRKELAKPSPLLEAMRKSSAGQ